MTNYRECLEVNSKNVIKTLEIYEHWISILPHFSTEQLVQILPILGSFLPPMILFWFGLVVQKPSSKQGINVLKRREGKKITKIISSLSVIPDFLLYCR